MAAIQFGAEDGEKFKAIVVSGVTVEQFKAIQAVNPHAAAAGDAESAARAEMLAAIKGAGAGNPGAGKEKIDGKEKDYMALVNDYAAANKVSKMEAMKSVMAEHPAAHKAYLDRANKLNS